MTTSRITKICLALTIVISAITAYTLSSHRVVAADDIFYLFVFDKYEMENFEVLKPITSYSDIVESQIVHYLYQNGRAPVHVLVQIFDAMWGYKVFGIFNALVFLLLMWAIVKLSVSPQRRLNPWIWIIVLLALLYLFPSGVNSGQGPWFGIAIGINYLWVGALVCWTILLINKLMESKTVSGKLCLLSAVVGFFSGWSNEAFAIPLSGALFFLLCQEKRARNKGIIILTIAVWLGTALVTFAPGSLMRLSYKTSGGIAYAIFGLMGCYTDAWPFWIFVGMSILARTVKKCSFKKFYGQNRLLCNMWALSLLLSIPAHTSPHSLTCLDLISLILALRLLISVYPKALLNFGRKSVMAYGAILILFVCHQSAIYKGNGRYQQAYLKSQQGFINSPEGLYINDYPKESFLISPFLDQYERWLTPPQKIAAYSAMLGVYGIYPMGISPKDYRHLIEEPDSFFMHAERIPGTANIYVGDRVYISKTIPHSEQAYALASFNGTDFKKSLSWPRRVVYSLLGNKKAPKPLVSYVLHTRNGDYLICERILSTPSQIDLVEP